MARPVRILSVQVIRATKPADKKIGNAVHLIRSEKSIMKQPRITVITPNLNQVSFVERAICSVIDQGYDNLEFIVVDGGSTDGSDEVIRIYEAELAHLIIEPDRGPGDAINKALRRATGQIIGLLPSTDLMLPGTLDQVARAMTADDGPDWLVGQSMRIGVFDETLGQCDTAPPASLASFLQRDSGFLPHNASFWNKAVTDRVGLFDPDLRYAYSYDYFCRMLAFGIEPTIATQTLGAYRVTARTRDAVSTLEQGQERIAVARRYADRLTMAERYQLWANCENRLRIYALAQAEMQADFSKRFLVGQLLRHPWWITNDMFRHRLLHGIAHPAQPDTRHHAA